MSAPELVAGYVVAGKYTIRSLLRQGGATATYRAVAAKNREVALKIYDAAILSFPDVLKALAHHQSLGVKLPADQIVPIADSGTDANTGAPFTVTDFHSGPSLAQLMDRGALSTTDTVALVRNLARVVELLHSNGIIGLTLHPHNVFIGPGAQFQARIGDFAATLVRNALPAPEKAGRWMPWLAPEQIKGQAPPAPTADIFALALIAFFAVTGKPYWRSSQVKVPDTAALRREILGERMPASVRASEFSITLNPAVDAIFSRALAFRPTDRYATAREFATGLEAALTGRSVAEIDAARPPTTNVGSATVKAGEAAPAANRAPSSSDLSTQRMAAPPPRKMPLRSTMLGMGSPQAAPPAGSSATAGGPRPPLNTMLGIGEKGVEAPPTPPAKAAAPATAPAKPSPPAMPPAMVAPTPNVSAPIASAPAKPPPPAMTTAPAKPFATMTATAPAKPIVPAPVTAPAKPFAPAMTKAMFPEPAKVVPPITATQRGGPPPLPMEPPPAQLEQALAQFEAASDRLLGSALPEPSMASIDIDVMQTPPTWPTAERGDAAGERVETGVAVVGTDYADAPRKSRLRWVASACGLLVLTGGAAWALSGRGASGSGGRAASDAKVTTTVATTPSTTAHEQAVHAVQPGTEEMRTGASLEPAPAAPPAPTVQEPEVAEPAPAPPPAAEPRAPTADSIATAPPAPMPDENAPSAIATPRTAPATPRAQPPAKPCGKFLKRCK